MIDLRLPRSLAVDYHSPSQRARVVTEHWVANNTVCPVCAQSITKTQNNSPGLDFVCNLCKLSFELKSKRGLFGNKLPDGAYESMIRKIMHGTHSNFFLLSYDSDYYVTNLVLVPKRFIVSEMIERRKPLREGTRRAGWTGCSIRVSLLPAAGKIAYIKDKWVVPTEAVLAQWRETNFLDSVSISSRGWLVAVMKCVERMDKHEFTLQEVYEFIPYLESLFPRNKHIKEKIRQQLQVLRDQGWLTFHGNGKYEQIVAH